MGTSNGGVLLKYTNFCFQDKLSVVNNVTTNITLLHTSVRNAIASLKPKNFYSLHATQGCLNVLQVKQLKIYYLKRCMKE